MNISSLCFLWRILNLYLSIKFKTFSYCSLKFSFISIDNFVKKKNIKKIDFIKIDVEGHEYNVLQGAIKTINKFRPIIIFEFNEITKALSKYSYKDYAYLIKKINYRIFGLKYGWSDILCPIQSLKNTQKISDLVIMK